MALVMILGSMLVAIYAAIEKDRPLLYGALTCLVISIIGFVNEISKRRPRRVSRRRH